MDNNDIYDEFNYEPDDFEESNEYKTESRDNKNLNKKDRQISQADTPHNEEYAVFDDLNEPDIDENYENNKNEENLKRDKVINNFNEVNSGSGKIFYDNMDKHSKLETKKFEIDNGNIDNYLDELIKNNKMEERKSSSEQNINKINLLKLNQLTDSRLINLKEIENEISEKLITPKIPPIAVKQIDESNKIQKNQLSNLKGINQMNTLSRMQIAEKEYKELKEKLEKLTEQPTNYSDANQQSVELLAKENSKLIKYLEKISEILDVVVESSKIPAKTKTKSNSNAKYVKIPNSKPKYSTNNYNPITPSNNINSNKLVEVYKKEFEKLQKRFKQISDPAYSEKLEQTIFEINTQLNYYEQENRNLKNRQKQSELLIERQYKNNNNAITNFDEETKKINQEYENMKRLNEVTFEKVQKNINSIREAEEKVKTLTEHNQKLQVIAKEMYNIDDFENFMEEEKNEQKVNERRQALKKKIDILEKVLVNNKKKYETEIARNDKTIINYEKNKLELMKILREKSTLAFKTAGFVKGIYDKNEIINSTNSHAIESEIKAQEMLEKFLNSRDKENEGEIENKNINNELDVINYINGKSITNNNNSSLIDPLNNNSNINLKIDKTYNNVDVSQLNNISNINRSIEDTKKEILRELDKKSIEKNHKSINSIDKDNLQIDNKSNLEPVEDNKYIGKNNKPNFKFNFSQQPGNNRTPKIITKADANSNNKPLIEPKDTEERLNIKKINQNDVIDIQNIRSKENLTKDETTHEIINPTPKDSNVDTSQREATNFNKDPILSTNSRRIHNPNQIKTNDTKRDINNLNYSNINNNTEVIAEEKHPDVPSFLKDYKQKDKNVENINSNKIDTNLNNSVTSTINNNKPHDKMLNFSQNNDISSIMNEIPRRRKDNLGTLKNDRKSIFEEALHVGFYEDKIESKKNEEPRFITHEKPQEDYYKKRKEEFDSLFKDEQPPNYKKEEIKLPSNNLIFARNRDSDMSINSKNVDDSIKKDKKSRAYANILDELEEIDLL